MVPSLAVTTPLPLRRFPSDMEKIPVQKRFISNASYHQQEQQGRHRCRALHAALVTLNLSDAVLQYAAFITAVIKNDVPQKRRFFGARS